MDSTFLKWAGGKNWFVKNYSDLLPQKYNRYVDPFLGGGALYFHLEPKKAIVSDINDELIITYQAIATDWERVTDRLKLHAQNHCKEYYYKIRQSRPRAPHAIAARMIYLNRTCFNGIYRVNRSGEFNVPIGSKTTVILPTDHFDKRAQIMRGTKFQTCDFEKTINKAKAGDFLFCDPPYAVMDEKSGFVGYSKNLFSWDDQVRLSKAIERARKRGVMILMTNVNHPTIRGLYDQDKYRFLDASRKCCISGINKGRNTYNELIILSNI
jgi:DNA adenine methylase